MLRAACLKKKVGEALERDELWDNMPGSSSG